MKEASIQKIEHVEAHSNAEKLDIATVLGWKVVVKKNEFKVGDSCVYITIDSVLPEKPEFEFLRNKQFRIKPIRLRGQESAGICFPLNIIPGFASVTTNNDGVFRNWIDDDSKEQRAVLVVGDDITELLGVKHYEKPIPTALAGQAVGHFPGFLKITDEDNLRSNPLAVPELFSRPFYITRKDDGSSGTYFIRNMEFGVCSRRIHLKETPENGFWKMAHKYNIKNAIETYFPNQNVAIQGEVVGPGIQGNKLGLLEMEFHVFNIFNIDSRTFTSEEIIIDFCKKSNIPMVTELDSGSTFSYTLEELIQFANKQVYPTGGPAEGIVVRPKDPFNSSVLKKYWSGKVINENYKEE